MPAPTDSVAPADAESPAGQNKEGAPAPPQGNDGHDRPVDSGDQDIDTAGTDHDDDSPTKSL